MYLHYATEFFKIDFLLLSIIVSIQCTGVKIAVIHQIFPTKLIKSMISDVDKFSKMSDSKKKKEKKIEIIWIITHNSQHITLLSVSMIKVKCKIKQKQSK